jgi:hypothetical protein
MKEGRRMKRSSRILEQEEEEGSAVLDRGKFLVRKKGRNEE